MPCLRSTRRCLFLLLMLCAVGLRAQEPQPAALSDSGQAAAREPVAPSLNANSLPLKPRSSPGGAELRVPSRPASSLGPLAGSLAIVLSLFFVAAWLLRRAMPKGSRLLPDDVVEVLGRAPLAGRQQMHLVRCGNKLLLLSVSSGAVETLTEITDPEEVDRIAGLCRTAHPQSATATFKHVLQQFGQPDGGVGGQGKGPRKGIGPEEDGDV